MTVEHYQALFAYNAWAYGVLLDRSAELDESDFAAPAGLDHGNGSILATLVHVLGTEEAWLERCQGRDLVTLLTENEASSVAALRARSEDLTSRWRSFLSELHELDLDKPVTNTSPLSGRSFTNPLWARLSHASNHATQHRSEVAIALTHLGNSPGDLDFLTYYAAIKTR